MKQSIRALAVITAAAFVLGAAGCASSPNNGEKTKKGALTGAAAGAVLGAVVGYQKDPSGGALRGAVIGAAAGGALGAGVGAYMDKQQADLDRQLAAEKAAKQMEVERVQQDMLRVTMSSEVSFDVGKSNIKAGFQPSLDKVASVFSQYPETKLTIVGHTDNTGKEEFNQKLSEDRARAVVNYLIGKGIAAGRLTATGRGELEPRYSNADAGGRAKNRRVEILVQTPPQQG